jgi:hypothetical protein
MRLLVAIAALVLGVSAHAQQGANAEPSDPAAKARVRVEGAAGGTGARVPPEASGGASVGSGSQHRHSAPKPPDTEQPPVEKSSERNEASLGATGANAPAPRTAGMPPRPGDDLPPRPGDYARPDTRDTQAPQDDKAEENPAKEKPRAEAKEER